MKCVEVISAWSFRSSAGTTNYETQLHADGQLTCDCPGWILRPKNGIRSCKHTKQISDLARLISIGGHERIFQKPEEKVKIIEKVVTEPSIEVRGQKRLLRTVVVG